MYNDQWEREQYEQYERMKQQRNGFMDRHPWFPLILLAVVLIAIVALNTWSASANGAELAFRDYSDYVAMHQDVRPTGFPE